MGDEGGAGNCGTLTEDLSQHPLPVFAASECLGEWLHELSFEGRTENQGPKPGSCG